MVICLIERGPYPRRHEVSQCRGLGWFDALHLDAMGSCIDCTCMTARYKVNIFPSHKTLTTAKAMSLSSKYSTDSNILKLKHGGGGGVVGVKKSSKYLLTFKLKSLNTIQHQNTQILRGNNSCKKRTNTSAPILSFRVNMDIQRFISKNKRTTGVLVVALDFYTCTG